MSAGEDPNWPRTFRLERDEDISGVSGTGVVAMGVVFPDGTTVIRWGGERRSTVVWDSLEDAYAIHGHGGATRIVFEEDQRFLSGATSSSATRPAGGDR